MSRTKAVNLVVEAVSGWVFDKRMVGHAAVRRGPVLIETYCGKSLPGQLTAQTPSKICRDCRGHIENGSYLPTKRAEAEEKEVQGRLW